MLKTMVRVWLRTSVVRKGLRGGSTFWLAMGAFGALRRQFEKHGQRTERVALGEQLRPGDELIVRYPGKPGRSTRGEIAEVRKRRNAEAAAHAKAVGELQARIDRGGFRARRAAKKLEALVRGHR